MEFKNPGDAVDIDALGLVGVEHGEVIVATGDHAKSLEAQGWPRVDKPKKSTTSKES